MYQYTSEVMTRQARSLFQWGMASHAVPCHTLSPEPRDGSAFSVQVPHSEMKSLNYDELWAVCQMHSPIEG